jgi:hypothetical protein
MINGDGYVLLARNCAIKFEEFGEFISYPPNPSNDPYLRAEKSGCSELWPSRCVKVTHAKAEAGSGPLAVPEIGFA